MRSGQQAGTRRPGTVEFLSRAGNPKRRFKYEALPSLSPPHQTVFGSLPACFCLPRPACLLATGDERFRAQGPGPRKDSGLGWEDWGVPAQGDGLDGWGLPACLPATTSPAAQGHACSGRAPPRCTESPICGLAAPGRLSVRAALHGGSIKGRPSNLTSGTDDVPPPRPASASTTDRPWRRSRYEPHGLMAPRGDVCLLGDGRPPLAPPRPRRRRAPLRVGLGLLQPAAGCAPSSNGPAGEASTAPLLGETRRAACRRARAARCLSLLPQKGGAGFAQTAPPARTGRRRARCATHAMRGAPSLIGGRGSTSSNHSSDGVWIFSRSIRKRLLWPACGNTGRRRVSCV